MSTFTEPLHLDQVEDRAALITALIAAGIPAVERKDVFETIPTVYVPLVNETPAEGFGLDLCEADCPCLIGVAGYRPDPDPDAEGDPVDVYSADYYGEDTLEGAVGQVQRLWKGRERLIAAFRAGHFDNGGLMEEVLV